MRVCGSFLSAVGIYTTEHTPLRPIEVLFTVPNSIDFIGPYK